MTKWVKIICLVVGLILATIPQAESQLPAPNVFAVRGTVFAADGVTPAGDGFVVNVENTTQGLQGGDMTGAIAGPSRYVTTFVDFNKPVAAEGDTIRVTVAQGGAVLATRDVTLNTAHLQAGFVVVDLQFTDGQGGGSFVFAVRGEVFLSDGTPAGNGLNAVVENLTKGLLQRDVTGAFAGPSGYVTTFVDTETPVADVGDVIEVRVESDSGGVLGRASETLTQDSVEAGLLRLNVTLIEPDTGLYLFVVRGTVFRPESNTPEDGLLVTVENLTRGGAQTDVTGRFAGPGGYVTTFLDTEAIVADVGDRIAVRVENNLGAVLGSGEIVLSREAIRAGFVLVNILLVPTGGTQVFGVRGTVLAYDDITPAGNGLRVTVTNTARGLTAQDSTGAIAGDSQYTVTFVSTDAVVADVGDTLEVQVHDGATSLLLGEATYTVTVADLAVGFATADVMLPAFPWDVNGDRVVNIFDLVLVGGRFGQTIPDPPPTPNPDVNGDGVVNIFDLVIIAGRFGETYNAPAAAPPTLTTLPPAVFTLKAVQTAPERYRLDVIAEPGIGLAGMQFDLAFNPDAVEVVAVTPGPKTPRLYWKPPTWNHRGGRVDGVALVALGESGINSGVLASIDLRLKPSSDIRTALPKLENLLAVDSQARLIPITLVNGRVEVEPDGLKPARTQLLRNYPNPFNPETWIPYRLAEASSVTIEIYNSAGRLVRTLDLGHQSPGTYETRQRAAFWNGRNDAGEPVASGAYFYHLRAGQYRATMKMTILK